MQLLKSGEKSAFTELYERYWKRLLVRTQILLNNYEDAEEIVHGIFVTLWKKKETITIEHSIHTTWEPCCGMDVLKCWQKRSEERKMNR